MENEILKDDDLNFDEFVSKLEKDAQDEFLFEDTFPVSLKKFRYKPLYTQLTKKILKYNSKKDSYSALQDILDLIIKDTCLDEIDIDEMYIGDRMFYMLKMKNISSDESIDVTETCPVCKSQFIQKIDLERELKIRIFDPLKFNPFVEMFSGYTAEMEMLKRRHNKEASAFVDKIEEIKKKNKETYSQEEKMADFTTAMIASSIKSISSPDKKFGDGLKIARKVQILSTIPQNILKKLNDWQRENSFGLVGGEIEIKCPHCNEYSKKINIFNEVFEKNESGNE